MQAAHDLFLNLSIHLFLIKFYATFICMQQSFIYIYREILTCALKTQVKKTKDRNILLEIVQSIF